MVTAKAKRILWGERLMVSQQPAKQGGAGGCLCVRRCVSVHTRVHVSIPTKWVWKHLREKNHGRMPEPQPRVNSRLRIPQDHVDLGGKRGGTALCTHVGTCMS